MAKRGGAAAADPFRLKARKDADKAREEHLHLYGNRRKCVTDTRGFATPRNDDRARLVVDASEGHIPLWAKGRTLRWRFQAQSLSSFANPEAASASIRKLFGEALLEWGAAVPVKFAERSDAWDFEIALRHNDDCDTAGCTLASAFFPDAGRHQLDIYPMMLQESRKEQVATLAHELGHVFGLRHFFAKVSEKSWPSRIFGTHKAFTIMNYGAKSRMTAKDRSDLKNLYALAWSGTLTEINGTPIRLVHPNHES